MKPNRNHLTLRRLNKDMTFYFIMPCLKLNTIIDWSEFHRGPASVDPGLVSRAPRRKNLFAVSSLVKHRNRLFIIVIIWFLCSAKMYRNSYIKAFEMCNVPKPGKRFELAE